MELMVTGIRDLPLAGKGIGFQWEARFRGLPMGTQGEIEVHMEVRVQLGGERPDE